MHACPQKKGRNSGYIYVVVGELWKYSCSMVNLCTVFMYFYTSIHAKCMSVIILHLLNVGGGMHAPKSVKACRKKIQTSMLKGTALFSTCRYDRHRMCQFSRLHFQAGWNLKALNVLMGEQSPGTHPGYQKGMHYIMQSHSKIMCVPYQGSGNETIMLTWAYLTSCSFWVYNICARESWNQMGGLVHMHAKCVQHSCRWLCITSKPAFFIQIDVVHQLCMQTRDWIWK